MPIGILVVACAGLDRHEGPAAVRAWGDTGVVDTGTPSLATAGVACYPGAAENFTACFELVATAWPEEDYAYPPPLDGSPQYRSPSAFLDLRLADPFVAIAPDFLLGETADSSDGAFAVVQGHAVGSLQAVRDRVGALIVTSGYRNPAHNAVVGGATWSRHMYGDAFDLVPLVVTLEELEDACWEEGASYVELYADHVHCDWRDVPLDQAFFSGG